MLLSVKVASQLVFAEQTSWLFTVSDQSCGVGPAPRRKLCLTPRAKVSEL